ncbi:hypothetical protein Scep_006399 [Stephania cephalantha]|uniref:Reverse transcriptase zinc-binding domain-containing protein n=1 Tax=Stephania cephalantha TaxID=152367 RepID=A0AAP0K840_9MAGN
MIRQAYKTLWKSPATMKIQVFGWLTWLGKLNTCDVLQRRCLCYVLCPTRCELCKAAGEYRSCAMAIWCALYSELGVNRNSPQSCKECIEGSPPQVRGGKKKTLWHSRSLHLAWGLWAERNNRIFHERER